MNNELNKFLERIKTDDTLRYHLKNYFICSNGKSFFDENNSLGIESIIMKHPEESSNYHHGYRWSALYDRINEMHKQLSEPKTYLLREIKSNLLEMYEAGGQYREALNKIILAEPDENILYNDYQNQVEKLKEDNNELIDQMSNLLRESAFKNETQILEIQKKININNGKINTLIDTFQIKNNEMLLKNRTCIEQKNLEESEITIIAKEKYKSYCSTKTFDKEIYYCWTNDDGVKVKSKIIMLLDELRNFGPVAVLEEPLLADFGFVYIPVFDLLLDCGKEPFCTNMVTAEYICSQFDFRYISQSFYDDILRYWDNLSMNEMIMEECYVPEEEMEDIDEMGL